MREWRVVIASTILLIVGIAVGCEGFFVDPILTGMTVGPAATIQTANTLQMTSLGTYNDGSQKKLGKNMFWSSASFTVATVNETGLVTGVGPRTKHYRPRS